MHGATDIRGSGRCGLCFRHLRAAGDGLLVHLRAHVPAFAVPFIIAAAQLQAPWGFFAALLLPLAFAALDGLLRCMDVSGLWGLFQKVVLKDEAKLALHCGHLVAEAKVPPGDKKVDRALFTALTKVLFENLAQSYLQAAFFGLSFASTKAPAKAKALGSLALLAWAWGPALPSWCPWP